MKTDDEAYTARILFTVGKGCEPGTFSYQHGPEEDPQVSVVAPGAMTGANLDVGDKIILEYTAPGVLSFICIENGADSS